MAISTKTKEYVALTYAKYFGRTADADTISNYVSIGKTSKILKQIIKDSNIEQYSVHGDDLKAEVHNEFQNLFSRNADNTELEKYVKVLKKGKDLPINSIVKKATKFDKDVYNNKQEIAKYVAENGGGVFDLSKVTKLNPIKVESLTSLTDLQAKIDALPENSKVPSTFDGETYILTASVDTGKDFVGTSKNDLFLAVDALDATGTKVKTLTLADSIDGGKGTEDTLKIVTDSTIGTSDFSDNTIKGIEIIDIKSTDTTAANKLTLDTTADAVKNNFKDVTDLHLTTAQGTGIDVTVNGTTNVTATATDNSATAGIKVTGGKAVSATLDALATATITGDSLTTVSVKGGLNNAIDNTDTLATSGAGETLKSVTFEANAAGTNTIKGNAIDTLTLKDQALALATTITNTKSTALTVNLNNVNTVTSTVTAGSKAETVTINSSGTVANTLILVAPAGKTLNITGDAAFTLGTGTPATITDILVTNSKGVTITDALGTGVKFTGGAGADNIKLTASFEKAINMGAGDDTVTYAAASTVEGKVGSVDAGADKDTIIMTSAQAVTASADNVFNTAFKNFEVLKSSNALTGIIDLEKINNVSEVELAVDGNNGTINNLVSGGRVAFLAAATTTASTNNLTVSVKNATTGKSDVLNLDLKAVAGTAVDFGKVTAANVETINITAADINTTAAGSAAKIAELELVATSATKVVVSGNNGLTLENATLLANTNAKITTFDASGVVSNGTTADLAADLAVTFKSTNITAGEAVTIIGGAGNDALTGTAQANDTITGGKGIDTITYTGGKDTFTGGSEADVFVSTAFGTKDLYLTISDFSGLGKDGDTIDVSEILNGGTDVFGAKIAVASGATFDQALDAAVKGYNGATNSKVNWFHFKGDTYVVADNSNTDTYTAGVDSFIKINGLVDLVSADITLA